MSGGSFEYVCFKDADEILDNLCYLDRMVKYLKGTGADVDGDRLEDPEGLEDLAKEIEMLWLDLRSFKTMIQTRLDRLKPVLKAIEWEASGDIGRDSLLAVWKVFLEGKRKGD